MDPRTDGGQTDGRTDRQTDEEMDRQTEGQKGGGTDWQALSIQPG